MRGYIGYLAQAQAQTRKQEASGHQRLKNDFTRKYVQEKLKLGWTPEQIGPRLAMEHKGYSISHEAIYQYIYIDYREGIEHLARSHRKRWPRGYGRKKHKSMIPGRVGIHERPEGINSRRFYGHWETDAIESNQSRCIINVNVERKSRFVKLNKLPTKHAKHTQKSVSETLKNFPKKLRQSITYDNGSENYHHLITNSILGTKSYFCAPYHSWEKGAVENMNSLIRRFIPKKTDLATVTCQELQKIENLLNDRPRKCLGFKTPREVFNSYCKQHP